MIKICIADDEEYVLKSIRRRIEQSGLDVEIAGTAKNGVEAFIMWISICLCAADWTLWRESERWIRTA